MQCPSCSKPIAEENWKFCPHCGFARESETGSPETQGVYKRMLEEEERHEQAAPRETELGAPSLRRDEDAQEAGEDVEAGVEEVSSVEEEEDAGEDPLEPEAETQPPSQIPKLVYEPDSPSAILSGLTHQAPTNIVSFTSDPPGAEVTINGERRGRTPVEMVLEPGVYTIRVTADGYLPFQGKLRYKTQDSFAHHVKLEPAPRLILPPGLKAMGAGRDKTTGLPLRALREADQAEMVFVPNTSFVMGLKKGNADEQPAHVVKTRAYYIDRYAITNEQFTRYVEDSRTQVRPRMWKSDLYNQPNQPVVGINWYEAREYCVWMVAELPTEAQWEKAARAPDGRLFPWGNTRPKPGLVCFRGSKEVEGPVAVDALPKNVSPYGAEQMSGNVFEWCADWYDPAYYGESPSKDPAGPEMGNEKAVRGGSWVTHPLLTRVTARAHRPPEYLGTDCGFRCVVPCGGPEGK